MGSKLRTLQESPRRPFAVPNQVFLYIESSCVSASPFTSARLVARLETPVGSFTASNMESSLTATCPLTRPLAMTPSKPSSLRLEAVSTSPEQSSSTWNPQLLTRLDVEHIANCIILSSLSMVRRTQPTTTPEDTTPSGRRLWI